MRIKDKLFEKKGKKWNFKSKRKYQKSYFEKHNSDIKKTWEGIRKL